MKTLYIARHAKSSWDDFSISDHDRPLLPKGIKKTELVAKKLKSLNEIPGFIISSTAKRAKETAFTFAKEFNIPVDNVILNRQLYLAYDDDIFEELYGIDNSVNSVMIVAHNPGLTDLVNNFSKDYIDNLPTSGVAKVVFKTNSWEKIDTSRFKLKFILTPKMLE